jgi:hypothetical protein
MTASYTFLTTDLASGNILGEVPMNGVALDVQLNGAGNMSAGGALSDTRISDEDFVTRTQPGRTGFWAYRENQIVWGGIIWTRQYQSNGKALTITGQTFESYAARRFPRAWLGTNTVVFNQGQCSLIDMLWSTMQNVPNGNISVLPCPGAAAIPNDIQTQLTVNGFDLTFSVDDYIQSILTLQSGPDYTIIWLEDDNGLPSAQLLVASRLGNPIGMTDLTVDYPGAIKDYMYNENASSGNNQWWAVGDGQDAAAVVGVATDQVALNSGYPLLEGVNSYSGVTDQGTIDAHAASDLAALDAPLITHNADLDGEGPPAFGTYGLGDYLVANVQDPRFKNGAVFGVRITGWTIQPPDEGQGTETITPVFDEATGSGG